MSGSETIATTPALPAEVSPLDTWESLTEGAHTTTGASLFKDEALARLVGVPQVITSVTFRPGIKDKATGTVFDYVSVESRIAPQHVLVKAMKRGQFDASTAEMLDPNETVVFNDGSTGIFRQITRYLEDTGIIALPDGENEGEKGASRYDRPREEWKGSAVEVVRNADGTLADTRYPVRLVLPRGLRSSTYVNAYTSGDETATTYYLA
jgi:hypothetical protein